MFRTFFPGDETCALRWKAAASDAFTLRPATPFQRLRRATADKEQSQPWRFFIALWNPFALKEVIDTKLRAVLRYQIRKPSFKAA